MANSGFSAKEIARVNNVAIVAGSDVQKLVPIKPLCEVLGINYASQYTKLKEDEDLCSVVVLSPTTGADGKTYEMACIPFEFVFGWLFTINPKNVKLEAQETVRRYRMECYHALYKYFSSYASFVNQKQKRQAEDWARYQVIQKEFHEAKAKLSKAKKVMNRTVEYSFEEWKCEQ